MHVRAIAVGALLGVALTLTGCGGGKVVPRGKVVNGAKPYDRDTDGEVSVSLGGADGKGTGASGNVEKDGTFRIGAESGGLPPGSYKVTVTQYPAANAKAGRGGPPAPTTKTLDETWDVASGKEFTLDLSKLK